MESMPAPAMPDTIGVDTHLELHVAGVDDAEHDGHHQQQVGDGRRSRGSFVGDEPVVHDIVCTVPSAPRMLMATRTAGVSWTDCRPATG